MSRVAVFIDGDNILPFADGGLPDVLQSAATDLTSASAVIAAIEREAQLLGDVIVREAYGRWDNGARQMPAAILAGLGYRLRHMPPLDRERGETHGLKNAADILLAVRTVIASGGVDTVAIVAMDSDYQPLIAELRSVGVAVVGIGFARTGTQAEILRDTFDYFALLPDVDGWEALRRWRRDGSVPAAIRPTPFVAMPAAQTIAPKSPQPQQAEGAPADVAALPTAPTVVPSAPVAEPGPPRPMPAPPPGMRRPEASAPEVVVDAAAAAVAAIDTVFGRSRTPLRSLIAVLGSFGLSGALSTTVASQLERDGWVATVEDDEMVLAPTEQFEGEGVEALRRVVLECIVRCTMAEADTLPGRADNPLDARLTHARARLDSGLSVQELLRLAAEV